MTRDELSERVIELFVMLAEAEPWDWTETDEGEPVVLIERRATFTGLDPGDVDLTAPIPNTSKVGVWRIEPTAATRSRALAEDPLARAGAEQAKHN